MFENLTDKVLTGLKKLRGAKTLNEKQLTDAVDLIKEALLAADVALPVVNEFTASTLKRAHGKEIVEGVSADEQFIAIVHDEIAKLIGGDEGNTVTLLPSEKMSVFLLFGLQGAGKTTTAAKLAQYYKDKRRVMLVGLDVHRPAAMDQLETLAKNVGVRYIVDKNETKVQKLIKKAMFEAKKESINLMIIDTAGRLEIDSEMMEELKRVNNLTAPTERLLVVDATIGQSAFDIAKTFKERVGISGVILSKFDSDAKGGAALSLRYATGSTVKFVGTGEHMGDIDEFNAERVAGRILGMGDVVGLVRKAQEAVDQKKAEETLQKVLENAFDYDDFALQIETTANMGGMQKMLQMMPGGRALAGGQTDALNDEEKKLQRYRYMIQSMTKKEKQAVFPLSNARKMRIAKGSGTSMYEVNQMVKHFATVSQMMGSKKKMGRMMGALEQMGLNMEDIQKQI